MIFKFLSLVMMETLGIAKLENEIVVYLFSCRPTCLVRRWVRLSKPCEVIHHHQYVFITALAWLQMEEVNADKFKWFSCSYADHWCSYWPGWGLLFDTAALLGDVVFNKGFHVGPVKTFSCQMENSVCC